MADGRRREDWLHTAVLVAKLHNMAGRVTTEDIAPADVYPFDLPAPAPPPEDPARVRDNWRAVLALVKSGGFR